MDTMASKRLRAALTRIGQAQTYADLESTAFKLVKLYRLANISYCFSPNEFKFDLTQHAISTYDTEWKLIYIDQNYLLIDPVVQKFFSASHPFNWRPLERNAPSLFKQAGKFGVGRQGLTIPLFAPFIGRALFSFTSHASNEKWKCFVTEQIGDMLVLASAFHKRFAWVMASKGKLPMPNFTARERDCLQLLVMGMACKQISAVIGISESTAWEHIRSCCKKMNCVSFRQLAPRALALGLVEPALLALHSAKSPA